MKHPFYPSSSVFTNIERKHIIIAVVLLALGFLAGWLAGARREDTGREVPTKASLEEEATVATTTTIGSVERGIYVYEGASEALRVADQKAGNAVYVASVALARPGWVAVREEADGEGGRILGARWFPAGEYEGTVKLLRNTMAGGRYHAFLFLDDGDKRFDMHKDTLITRNGLLILAPFTAY
ncbi:MAG TPA: hypothetical protein VJ837_02065 [Candidatus Paceibacterota bacterium]|nr:hypothetical protein [Candidatus Paceibacterota bacterium]